MNLFVGCNGYVAAVDLKRGHEVWRTELRTGSFMGGSSRQDICILEHEGRVYAGTHGELFALDGENGRVLWQNRLEGMGFNDVTLAMAGKSVQFVTTTERSDR